jgi:O-antigen/teichoic acid export membrane protein
MKTFVSEAEIEDRATRSWFGAMGGRFEDLKSNAFLRNVGVMSSGSALGHVFTLAAGPILTRIYSPGEFGALGLFTSIVSMVSVAITLQYEISIPVGRDENEAAYLTLGCLLLSVPMSILAGVLLWVLIRTSSLGCGSLPRYAPLLLIPCMIFIGVFSALRYWALREGHFRAIAQGTVVQSAARALFQTGMGAAGFHSGGLLAGETLGRCMGMSKLFRSSWLALKGYIRRFRWSELTHSLWTHRKFPLLSFPSSFLDALCLSLPLPLLVWLYGISTGGYYSLVWKAIAVPSVLITVAVADTFHGRLAICARDEPAQVLHLFRSVSLGLLLAGMVPAATIWLFGPALFGWVFGAKWVLSGTMAAIITPWYLAQFVVSPLSRVVVVLSGQEMKLIWDVLCLVALLGVFSFAHWRSWQALETIRLLSTVYALLFVVYYVVLLRIIARFNRTQNLQTAIV